jgi:hypothetical protein
MSRWSLPPGLGARSRWAAPPTTQMLMSMPFQMRDYGPLCNRRYALVQAMGRPVLQDDHPNFEGLGFDLVHFELDDGVSGEIAFGHTGNFLTLHGGPHEVLLDRIGLLDNVSFPLL